MSDLIELPLSQVAIRSRCFHPNNTFVKFKDKDVEQSIVSRFEQQSEKYSDRVAVKTKTNELTYEQLNLKANQISHSVLAQSGDRVEAIALLLEVDDLVAAAMLGVLKANKYFITLDPSFPIARIAYMLEDSRARLIVTNNQHLELAYEIAQDRCTILNIEEIARDIRFDNPNLTITPDSFSYMIYTSGSTGQPKGIIYDHRGELLCIRNYTNAFQICNHDRLTLLHSPSFSSAMVDIFCALLNGASVFPWNIKRDGFNDLGPWLAEEGITIFSWSPTPFRYFVETISRKTQFPQLRILTLGGEPVYLKDVELYKKYFAKNCVFVNRLGTSETHNFRLYFLDHESQINKSRIPAGYAVPDKQVLLLDENGQDVEFGQVGEIAIKSSGLAIGYWQRPELTNKLFLTDLADGDTRIYKTGDLGVLHPDDCLEYLGRKDFQVKVRGHRVEIAEIEAVLSSIDAVKDAVVVAREDEAGETQLNAYFVSVDESTSVQGEELRGKLLQRLPDYMVPTIFEKLDILPLSPTGKVDRDALLKRTSSGLKAYREILPPRDEIEERLSISWEKVLEIHPVGVKDNFFDIGGHSLSAMRLLVDIERRFGRKLAQTTIYQYPTIEKLAKNLREIQGVQKKSTPDVLAITPNGSKPPFFCAPGILGNVFVDMGGVARHLGSDQPFYGLQDGLGLPAKIERLAAYYLKQIRTVQPQGPYLLGGICSGALTAYEIAQQLLASGESVALLAFVEPVYPWVPSARSWLDFVFSVYGRFTKRMDYHSRNILQLSTVEQNTFFRLKMKLAANMWAYRQYSAHKYLGNIQIFSTSDSLKKAPRNFQASWDDLATNGTKYHEVPGTHNEITGEFNTKIDDSLMQVIAKNLKTCIDKAVLKKN